MNNAFSPKMVLLNGNYEGDYSGGVDVGEPEYGTTYVDSDGHYWTWYTEDYFGEAGFYNENLEKWPNGSTIGDNWVLV